MIFASRMLTDEVKDSTCVVVAPIMSARRSGTIRMISPVWVGSAGSTLNTPGRTVAICVGESLVMIVAMMLPPSAGRVCRRMAVSALKSPISSLVQSAVRPESHA